METSVSELLKKNKFSKKHIYRIKDSLLGYKNYEYVGRGKHGSILMSSSFGILENLRLFDSNADVIVIENVL